MNAHNIGDVMDGTVKFIIGESVTVELAPHVHGVLYGKPVLSLGSHRIETADGRIVTSGETVRVKIEKLIPQLPIFPIVVSLA